MNFKNWRTQKKILIWSTKIVNIEPEDGPKNGDFKIDRIWDNMNKHRVDKKQIM